jgi:hypothetical protein
MPAVLINNEDEAFDALWGFVASLFDVTYQPNIFKGFQNQTATPNNTTAGTGSYVVIQPGIKVRQDQARRDYDATNGLVNVTRGTTYSYQVDCYGQDGANNADIISIAWRSMWACDQLAGSIITPLYADEPEQLNLVNGENQFEQRFMAKLYLQTNTVVALPQDFFSDPVPVDIVVADDLPLQ